MDSWVLQWRCAELRGWGWGGDQEDFFKMEKTTVSWFVVGDSEEKEKITTGRAGLQM